MAFADTLKYWDAMAALRNSVPITPGVRGTMRSCQNADLLTRSDLTYPDVCAPPWLEFGLTPDPNSARLCFPVEFYQWCQRYVSQALTYAPDPGLSSSAEFRVVWALDVWAHVSYALFALNLDWSALAGNYVDLRAPADRLLGGFDTALPSAWGSAPLVKSFAKVVSDQLGWLRTAKDSAIARAERQGGNALIIASYKNAPIKLPTFATLPIFWVGQLWNRASTRSVNPLWPLLLDTIQPWSSNWSQNYLLSYKNKDQPDVNRYLEDDAVMRVASMQWRLFSARDFVTGGGELRLSQYIDAVGAEPQDQTFMFPSVAVPTHAWSVVIVREYARLLTSLEYAQTTSDAQASYLADYAPRVNPDATPMTQNQWRQATGQTLLGDPEAGNQLAYQSVTGEDWRSLWKGLGREYAARALSSLAGPSLKDCGGNTVCQKAVKELQQARTIVTATPVGPAILAEMALGKFLVDKLGAAVGNVYFPVQPLPAPVARTLSAQAWSFAPTGSTADVWLRWGIAWKNYASVLPSLFLPPKQIDPTRAQHCKVWSAPGWDVGCYACDDQLPPPCAQDITDPAYHPPSATPLALQAAARSNVTPELQNYCLGLAGQWLKDNPQYKDCVGAADLPVWNQICYAVGLKQISFEQGATMWGQYVTNMKKCVPARTLWDALKQGVAQGTNPLQQSTHSSTFAARVYVPINPFRAFGKEV